MAEDSLTYSNSPIKKTPVWPGTTSNGYKSKLRCQPRTYNLIQDTDRARGLFSTANEIKVCSHALLPLDPRTKQALTFALAYHIRCSDYSQGRDSRARFLQRGFRDREAGAQHKPPVGFSGFTGLLIHAPGAWL